MNSRAGTAGRCARAAALGVTAAVLAVGLAACPEAPRGVAKPMELCSVRYSFEVANDASDRVRVRITIAGFSLPGDILALEPPSGILSLEGGEKRPLSTTWGLPECDPSPENSREHISSPRTSAKRTPSFAEIQFYDQQDSENPYRSYSYVSARCEDQPNCNRVIHQSTDGTWDNLFVKSPQRPFYLERDGEAPDLARIVITYVPDGGATSGERRE